MDQVLTDLNEKSVRDWKQMTQNRKERIIITTEKIKTEIYVECKTKKRKELKL